MKIIHVHSPLYSVKRYVQNHGLRYRAVVKATERQLRKTLAEMFPDWMIGQRYDINSHGRRKLIVRSVAVFSSTMICAPVNSVTGNWNASATRVM
jgi:hypothetical protein